MDSDRFDQLTRIFGGQNSRRVVLSGVAKGGVAALLAAVGITTLNGDAAEAAKKCGKKCRRRKGPAKRRCLRKCRKSNKRKASNQLSSPIGVGPILIGGACTSGAQCASGNCSLGFCADCDGIRVCGSRCCLVTASCVVGLCVKL